MDVGKPLKALPEPTAPGIYLGWVCRNCTFPIKVSAKGQYVDAAPSEFVELRCETCGKVRTYLCTDRQTIEVLPPGT